MDTAQPQAPATTVASSIRALDRVRKCLVTGEELAKDAMIRFVIAPDGTVVPDLARNLPGRGLWVSATRATLETATKKNLFARAAKAPAKPAADLPDQTMQLVKKRCLDLLGLARGAGIAVLGQMQVEMAAKAERLGMIFVADDAGRDIEKLGSVGLALNPIRTFTRKELGDALGYDLMVYVGLTPHQLTTKLRDAVTLMTDLSPHPPLSTSLATETDA